MLLHLRTIALLGSLWLAIPVRAQAERPCDLRLEPPAATTSLLHTLHAALASALSLADGVGVSADAADLSLRLSTTERSSRDAEGWFAEVCAKLEVKAWYAAAFEASASPHCKTARAFDSVTALARAKQQWSGPAITNWAHSTAARIRREESAARIGASLIVETQPAGANLELEGFPNARWDNGVLRCLAPNMQVKVHACAAGQRTADACTTMTCRAGQMQVCKVATPQPRQLCCHLERVLSTGDEPLIVRLVAPGSAVPPDFDCTDILAPAQVTKVNLSLELENATLKYPPKPDWSGYKDSLEWRATLRAIKPDEQLAVRAVVAWQPDSPSQRARITRAVRGPDGLERFTARAMEILGEHLEKFILLLVAALLLSVPWIRKLWNKLKSAADGAPSQPPPP